MAGQIPRGANAVSVRVRELFRLASPKRRRDAERSLLA